MIRSDSVPSNADDQIPPCSTEHADERVAERSNIQEACQKLSAEQLTETSNPGTEQLSNAESISELKMESEGDPSSEKMEVQSEGHRGSESKMEIERESDRGSESKMEIEREGDRGSESKMEIERESDRGSESKMEIEREGDRGSESKMEIEREGDRSSEPKTEIEREGDRSSEPKTEIESEGDPKAESKMKVDPERERSSESKKKVESEGDRTSESKTEVDSQEDRSTQDAAASLEIYESLFLPEEPSELKAGIHPKSDHLEEEETFIIKLSDFSGGQLPPRVDLAKYTDSVNDSATSNVQASDSFDCDTTVPQIRPFSPHGVGLDGAKGRITLAYRTRGARVVLLGILAFAPVWAIWLPYALSLVSWRIIYGIGDAQDFALLFVFAAVLVGIIFQIACCLDKKLQINSDGITFPMNFICLTGFRRTRPWSALKSLAYKPNEESELESTLTMRFKDARIPLTVGGFAKEDLRKLIFAAQTHCCAVDANAKNALLPTFTELWEEELSSRFSPTVFVPLQPGTRIRGDQIEVLGQVACGGLSAIYMGRTEGQRRVIVKEFVTPASSNGELSAKALELFAREAEVLKSLKHPAIAKVIDHFSEDSRHYLVLEHISGIDLRRFIRDNGRQHEEIVLRWAIDVADVLDHLHTQTPPIIHRDLTPDNLIFTAHGGIAVIDFGAASAFVSEATGTLIGKQNYMAPEQFRGRATPQSDIYALGCVMHFLLTGVDPEPLETSHPQNLNSNVSDATERLVAACTALELADRIDSVPTLASRLRGVLNIRRLSVKAGM